MLQVIWVCILCRKKQELLSKTGQWISKGMVSSQQDSIMRRIEADMQGGILGPGLVGDKRPKLERAHSAAEKENQPLLGLELRRQYSQQEDERYYRGELEGLMRSHQQQRAQQHMPAMPASSAMGTMGPMGPMGPGYRHDSLSSEQSSSMDMGSMGVGMHHPHAHPHAYPHAGPPGRKQHKRQGSTKRAPAGHPGHPHHPVPQRSFSSSDDELRSTPDCTSGEEHDRDSEKGE